MKIQISKKVGLSTLTFEVEGEKEVDTLAKAAAFTTMPDTCTLCKSIDVCLDANKAEGFTFVKVKCNRCGARANMGQFKDGSGIFFKKFEIWKPDVNDEFPDKK